MRRPASARAAAHRNAMARRADRTGVEARAEHLLQCRHLPERDMLQAYEWHLLHRRSQVARPMLGDRALL